MILQHEFNRAIARQFPVQFHRDILVATNSQSLGLKIFNLSQSNLGAEEYVLEIFDDLEIAHLFECHHVEKPIIQLRLLKEWKRAAVSPAVSD